MVCLGALNHEFCEIWPDDLVHEVGDLVAIDPCEARAAQNATAKYAQDAWSGCYGNDRKDRSVVGAPYVVTEELDCFVNRHSNIETI